MDDKSGFRPIEWFFRPNPDIDYNVVSLMYAAGLFLCGLFYTIEVFLARAIVASEDKASR